MHSATMKMSEAEFITYAEAMKGLLDDPLFMCHIPDAKNASNTIKEVRELYYLRL